MVHHFLYPEVIVRAFVPDLPVIGSFTLQGDEAFHLIKVRRVKPGERIELLDGQGGRAQGTVRHVQKHTLTVEVDMSEFEKPAPDLGLVLALPVQVTTLASMMPGLVQVGVTHFFLIETEFSGQLKKYGKQINRLTEIIKQSLKQCGRSWMPTLESGTFRDVLERIETLPFNHHHLCHPGGTTWEAIRPELNANARFLNFIGPEGGFSSTEVEAARQKDIQILGLGQGILKMETAAVCVCFRAGQWVEESNGKG